MTAPLRRPTTSALLATTLAALALAVAPDAQSERRFEDGDLRRLGAALAGCLEARAEDAGVPAAEAELAAALAELEGEELAGRGLSLTADLGRAAWLARDHARHPVKKGKVTTEELREGSFRDGLEYAYSVPKDYDPKRTAYPLVLAIPDEGEEPALHLRTHWLVGDVLDRAVVVCPAMPEDTADWEHVAVRGRPGGLARVLTLLRFAGEHFAVDFDRVYLVGRGAGVPAALAAGNHAPQTFAGVACLEGEPGERAADNFTSLPTFFFACGGGAEQFRHALRALQVDNVTLAEAGAPDDVLAWMDAHPRSTAPERVVLVVGKPFPTRAYWLRVAPSAPYARAEAALDRAGNSILVSTAGVSRVTLYLNDALLDLGKPVHVLLDGVAHLIDVRRRPGTLVDLLADGTSDPGCVYAAEVALDTAGEGSVAPAEPPEPDPATEKVLADASAGVDDLWALYERCQSSQRTEDALRALRRILRREPDHAGARAALGYHGEPGLWFDSAGALARHRASQDEAVATAKGHVLDRELWIHRDERAFANGRMERDHATGQWIPRADLRKLDEGWSRQDLEWIEPEDAAHVDDGLWRVDGEWLPLDEANRRHAGVDSMWTIPRREVLLHATTDRNVALWAAEHMGRAVVDLNRVFGAEPLLPLEVCLLRDEEQYDRMAFGAPDGSRPATDASRLYLVHTAYFAQSWFEKLDGKLAFRGMGVTYWDPLAPNGNAYGVHAARLAVGLSYVEALDPSPKAVRKALSSGGPDAGYLEAYEAEKLLPRWLRLGGAVYAERFFQDTTVAEDGDPWWARNWSLNNLASRGGLRPLPEVLAHRIDPDDRDDGLRWLLEAGLLVSFVVDGDCAPVEEAHAELKRVLAAGRARPAHVEALTEALLAHEAELRKYAGFEEPR